jgi:hypothetical protein
MWLKIDTGPPIDSELKPEDVIIARDKETRQLLVSLSIIIAGGARQKWRRARPRPARID